MAVNVIVGKTKLLVFSPKNEKFIDAVKRIEGEWNKEKKYWSVPTKFRDLLDAALKDAYPDEVINYAKYRKTTTGTAETVEPVVSDVPSLQNTVNKIVADKNAFNDDTLERLVAFAYWYGREQATKEVSDAYRQLIKEMNLRAEETKYEKMIKRVIGDKTYIIFKDYNGTKTTEFGNMITKLFDK